MDSEEIKNSDLWVINEDCTVVPVDIPKKGVYEYIHIKGERSVLCAKEDKEYSLNYLGGSWMCACRGFTYRRHCSHIDNVPEEIENLIDDQNLDPKNPKKDEDSVFVRAAKGAFMNEWDDDLKKMVPILNNDGSRQSAYDGFWPEG